MEVGVGAKDRPGAANEVPTHAARRTEGIAESSGEKATLVRIRVGIRQVDVG